jgi:integrase
MTATATTTKTDELLHRLTEGVEKLTSSDEWVRYLDVQRRFHRYSFGNVLLIALQSPDATRVAGFRRWLELGRHVQHGQKGIAILAPVVSRLKVEDKETGEERTIVSAPRASGAKPPRPRRPEPVLVDPALASRILAAVKGTTMELPAAVALATGMRRGEILALRWGDLDEGFTVAQVRRSLQVSGEGLHFVEPKTRACWHVEEARVRLPSPYLSSPPLAEGPTLEKRSRSATPPL